MHRQDSAGGTTAKASSAACPTHCEATRYHSLVTRRDTFHDPDFVVSAWTAEGEIMGVRHRRWPPRGVQFHPESFLTAEGPLLLRNFLDLAAPARHSAAPARKD